MRNDWDEDDDHRAGFHGEGDIAFGGRSHFEQLAVEESKEERWAGLNSGKFQHQQSVLQRPSSSWNAPPTISSLVELSLSPDDWPTIAAATSGVNPPLKSPSFSISLATGKTKGTEEKKEKEQSQGEKVKEAEKGKEPDSPVGEAKNEDPPKGQQKASAEPQPQQKGKKGRKK
jgi:hypothetical protein